MLFARDLLYSKVLFSLMAIICFSTHSFAWTTPTFSSPSNNATTWSGIELDWNAVSSSNAYQLQVDTSPNFNSAVLFSKVEGYINSSSRNADTEEFVTDLYFGQKYYWRVRAWQVGDTAAWSSNRTFTTNDFVTLSAPSNNAGTWSGVEFDWNAHDGVNFYEIQIDTSLNFNSPVFTGDIEGYVNSSDRNADTEEFLSDLLFGTKYYWRVRAINASDTSAWTQRTITTLDQVNLTSPNNNANTWTGVTFDWNAHDGVNFYEIQIDTSLSFSSPVFTNDIEGYINSSDRNADTEEFLTDMLFGTTYYWRVRAINARDTSNWTQRTLNTLDYVNLTSPNNNASTWSGLTFDWNAHVGVDFYEIQIDTTTSFNSPVFTNDIEGYINSSDRNLDTEEFLTDMLFGKTYYWRVRAINARDTSNWTQRTLNTLDYVTLTAPNNGATTWTGVEFDWNAHDGVDFYEIQLDTSTTFNSPMFKNDIEGYINSSDRNLDTEEFLSDMLFGHKYYWRVRAINSRDTSNWTMRNLITRDFVTLTSPANGAITWAGLEFDWNAHDGVDFYEIQVDTSSQFTSSAFKNEIEAYVNSSDRNLDTEEFISDLYFGENYHWRVRAINAVDTSEWTSRIINTRDFVTLSFPSNMATNQSTSNLRLNWAAHDGVDFYEVERDTSNLFNTAALSSNRKTYINTSDNNSDTYHNTGTQFANQQYFWRVRAINAVDTTAWTSRTYSTGTGFVISGIPTLANPANNANNINTPTTLSWNTTTNAKGYEVQYSTDANFSSFTTNTRTTTSLTVNSLATGTTYYWRARSFNGGYYSDWSTVRNFSTCAPVRDTISVSACGQYISPSGKYTWSMNNAYLDTLSSSAGCDSILLINLSIKNSSTSTLNDTACANYLWRGTNYTISGTYRDTLLNSVGCDSILVLNLTINQTSSSTQNATACSNYTWNGNTYSKTGIYKDTLTNSEGCDSVSTLNLTINNGTSFTFADTACNVYNWNGKNYSKSGRIKGIFTGSNGCDSTVNINLIINKSTFDTITVTACNSYISPSGRYTWLVGSTYQDTIKNSEGCDSVLTINLTVNNASFTSQTVTNCDSFLWKGVTYYSSGTYRDTSTNSVGCDSISILNLTVKKSSSSSLSKTVCNSFTWRTKAYTNSGIYRDTITNSAGCDSVLTLNLTVNRSSSSTISPIACEAYTSPSGKTYTSSSTFTDTINNTAGCDSVITVNLTVNKNTSSNTTATACDSYSWLSKTFTSSGVYRDTLINAIGCDSLLTLNLTINNSTSSTENTTACDSYFWNGKTYSNSGTYLDTIQNIAGCDSLMTLNLTINRTTSSTQNKTACDTYSWNGKNLTSTGVYVDTLRNSLGCDSITTLILTINKATTSAENQTVCEEYNWNGRTLTTSGLYLDTMQNASGCDSIITLNLTVNNSTTAVIDTSACDVFNSPSGNYTWMQSGTYKDTILNSVGCDSILTINLTINTINTTLTTDEFDLKSNEEDADYKWVDCDLAYSFVVGANGQTFVPKKGGNYAVIITKDNCVDTSSCVSFTPLSVEGIEALNSINIYPNPSSGLVNIDLSDFKNVQLDVINANGQLVVSEPNLTEVTYELNLGNSPGVYVIRVKAENNIQNFRLVIQN